MRKIFATILAILVICTCVFSLTACGASMDECIKVTTSWGEEMSLDKFTIDHKDRGCYKETADCKFYAKKNIKITKITFVGMDEYYDEEDNYDMEVVYTDKSHSNICKEYKAGEQIYIYGDFKKTTFVDTLNPDYIYKLKIKFKVID